jgi:hypothetical protein
VQYYKLGTCEPSEGTAELGKKKTVFCTFLYTVMSQLKCILPLEVVRGCCFAILKSVPGIAEVFLTMKPVKWLKNGRNCADNKREAFIKC